MKFNNREELSTSLYQLGKNDPRAQKIDIESLKQFKKLFKDKTHGVRFYNFGAVASFMINYTDKTFNMMGLFCDIDKPLDDVTVGIGIARLINVAEALGFKFSVAVHSFCFSDKLNERDKLIMATKYELVFNECFKDGNIEVNIAFNKRQNDEDIIDKTKELVEFYESGNRDIMAFGKDGAYAV